MGSIPDTQGLFFVSQAMNGSLSIYKGLEETKTLELSTEHRKSRIPLTSHEKENQSHLKAKNLQNLPPVPKGKTVAQKQASLIRTALMETQPPTPKRKVRVYTSNKVETELEAAKREYLLAAIGVTAERKVLIPKLLDWYMWDFAKDKKSLLEWICEQLPISSRATVEECLKGKTDECVSQVTEVMPYEFAFRYLLPL